MGDLGDLGLFPLWTLRSPEFSKLENFLQTFFIFKKSGDLGDRTHIRRKDIKIIF